MLQKLSVIVGICSESPAVTTINCDKLFKKCGFCMIIITKIAYIKKTLNNTDWKKKQTYTCISVVLFK